ncbi:hypothetical protein L1D14_04290 [Vibrio tubiashii]|uniref:hypothetical protein n=1 Tax=Vibrio tubiashii TaxID=29498 RepID=UPI001EFC3F65|nr:hypothetical protein [Vibrio tubiashii]MCG9575451.1 hypothetical protein [Vibrio tubiashii]
MIYTYAKSLEVTGQLHSMSSPEEKQRAQSFDSSRSFQPQKYTWLHLKPFMLKLDWFLYENNDGLIEGQPTLSLMPYGTRAVIEENRLYWTIQSKKYLLRYLYHSHIADSSDDSDRSQANTALVHFKSAMKARRQCYGYVSQETTPELLDTKIMVFSELCDALRSQRHTAGKRALSVERQVGDYLNAVITKLDIGTNPTRSVNDSLLILKHSVYEHGLSVKQAKQNECYVLNEEWIAKSLNALVEHLPLIKYLPTLSDKITELVQKATD